MMIQPGVWLRASILALVLALGVAASYQAVAEETDIQPVAAAEYPLAKTSLMLDIEDTGKGFVAVGERGHVLLSQDGENWEQVDVPINSLLTAVSFTDSNNGWAVGHDAAILHTTDGGHSWSLQHFEPTGAGPLLDVQFDNSKHGFAVGAFGTFLETNDAGKTWQAVDAPVVSDAAAHLYSVTHFDTGRWLLVGEMGFIAMSDDGQEWVAVESPYDGSFYASVQFRKNGALLVGMRGNAFLTGDLASGKWNTYKTDTVLSLTSANRINEREFLVTTVNRQLLRLDSSGHVETLSVPFTEQAGSNTGSFNDIAVSKNGLLIASDHGIVHAPLPPTKVSLARSR